MRIRATMAAATVSGALALTAIAVPAAQASYQGTAKPDASSRFGSLTTVKAPLAAETGVAAAPTINSVSVNGGKNIVVGTTTVKTFTVSVTASHASGIADAYVDLWHGTDVDSADGFLIPNEDAATCTASSATTSTCKLTITADPQVDLVNSLAGTWHVTVGALAGDQSDFYWNDYYSTRKVLRLAKLTANASPEPVAKGKTITVTGSLTRANWDTSTYGGYANQSVKLQFRKAGTSTYSTVKTITSSSTGGLKTTVTASVDGYWRYSFAGSPTTGTVSSAGDYVDVQ
ncbi:calcium-binding protein [Streptomyces sp. PSKA54]|uniref:Calcium-binding protein n=1 Tax=Streptomyces himalayensis subsp. aureolus TaxID=2758039 RepID=A0A7W2HK45_9ACTN|nr:DUF5707 domain-containing protein [Streptomyces himalayensis]MBA4866776.1 calcium-binding protein [Streptomyces himalayensis subsp. aureolus]